MEDILLKELWKAQDAKLERSLELNMLLLSTMQKDRARTKLDKLARFKSTAFFLGVLWCAFLALLIYGNGFKNIWFEASVIAILLFNVFACVAYLRQVAFIKKLDYSDSIINTQKKLAGLQVSTINTTRILMLQAPFYTTWFYTTDLVLHDLKFQLISIPITLLFVISSLWLYKKMTIENMNKKWLRSFMNLGPEYRSVTEARDFLQEIETFKTAGA